MHDRIAIDTITPCIEGGIYPAKGVVGEYVPLSAVIWKEGNDLVGARALIRKISDTPLESEQLLIHSAQFPGTSTKLSSPIMTPPSENTSSKVSRAKKTSRTKSSTHTVTPQAPTQNNVGKHSARNYPAFAVHMYPTEEPDQFLVFFCPDTPGFWTFSIEAYLDIFANWRDTLAKKLAAGFTAEQLYNELHYGQQIFLTAEQNYAQYQAQDTPFPFYFSQEPNSSIRDLVWEKEILARCELIAQALIDPERDLAERTQEALSAEIQYFFHRYPLRDLITISQESYLWIDRKAALYSAWYEFFPRSTGGWDAEGQPIHGNFHTAAAELERIAQLGFNTIYLPPIHPIGFIHRKGKNNSQEAMADDIGSPWAIGSTVGGHMDIHPALGTVEDFSAFLRRAQELQLEIALDFALQCAPDHPWVKTHPEWFTTLPDGTIACAENPPKIYHDIYPIDFDQDPDGIYQAALEILLYWISLGVTIFRVDNPHTKPPNFWKWLIQQVKSRHPEVLFLAEAFTRPSQLYGLAKRGFSQSYTYFTWRITKYELTELVQNVLQHAAESRPNFFTNTPDILHESLQFGGPAMFAIRAVLAASLSPSWGIYSGFELYENQALTVGSEEYLDSEKYQLRPRNYDKALGMGESLAPWISQLNHIRQHNPALQQLRNIAFHPINNDHLFAYSKYDIATGNNLLIVVNLDPQQAQEGIIDLNLPLLGQAWDGHFEVIDILDGSRYWWGQNNFIRLQPWLAVCHIFLLPPIDASHRVEIGGKYYSEFQQK